MPVDVHELVSAYSTLARRAQANGQYERAAALFERAKAVEPRAR
jgi:hypothetical protein